MSGAVTTVCGYCGVGCGMVLHLDDRGTDGRLVARVSGRADHPANRGRLCTKGSTTAELLAAPGRLEKASIRADRTAERETVDLDTAIAHTASRLRAIIDEHGPDAVAIYVSGQLTLEAQYLATKLAKGYLRTAHLESNSRLCMASAGTGYKQSLGADGPPGSYDDIDHADLFLVTGANMADCHPVLFLRLMERVKSGAKLIVVDPRRTATAAKADLHLAVRPGTDLALLNGLLHLLVAEGAVDEDFVARHTEGWEQLLPMLDDYDPVTVARITGVAEQDLRTAAAWIAAAPDWVSCWTMGLNQSTHGTWNTNALCNLHLATGTIGRTGSGPFSLTGQPNAMGGREMGYMGPGLPGQRTVTDAEDRAFVERAWQLPSGTIRSAVGSGTIDLFEQLADGRIKACWILGTNPVASVPNRSTVIAGLERAELVVVQDLYAETATLPYADVVLPAALWTEQEGVMVNSERTMTLCEQATEPPGDARADWELIARMASALGFAGFDHTSAADVFDELARFANPRTGYDIGGVDHERLRRGPVQWPCPPGDDEDRHPIRYRTPEGLRFPTPSGRAIFHPRPHLPPREQPDDDYPLVLLTGRVAHQWHTMTKTSRVAALNRLDPAPFVEIHPEDAAAQGIEEGQFVRLVSRRGAAVVPARIADTVQRGTCFAPFHWNDVFGPDLTVNAVTFDAVDPESLQPEIKACAVRLVPQARRVASEVPTVETVTADVVVAWASQTGTVESAIPSVVERLTEGGVDAAAIALNRLDLAALPRDGTLLLSTSTTGDGEPPDAARRWWSRLCSPDAPRLDGLRYAVVAFGDSAYADFCGFGKALDERLAALGAARILPVATCERDFATQLSDWTDEMTRKLGGRVAERPSPVETVRRDSSVRARLVRNVRLTGPTSAKDVRHLGFLLPEGVEYRVGDALGVRPVNDGREVERWLSATGVDGAAVHAGETDWRTALSRDLDISALSRSFLGLVVDRHPGLRTLLAPGRDVELARWSWGRRMTDVLAEYPVRADAEVWREVLRPLALRQYSISSSPLVDPREAHVTVSAVRWGDSGGVCSTFLADRCEGEAEVVVQPNPHFRPPADPDVPTIMIGPGTGVAPFRGFLHDDRARGVRRRSWLFFGDQHRDSDFLYREELEGFLADGTLTRLDLAFSRDQAAKVYVQHRMREHAAELWRWLDAGARIYVCGDREFMARDVHLTLRDLLVEHGGHEPRTAEDLLDDWSADGRYLRDVY